jgi:DNA-directed RNA polymerase specialized sigma24 family protein
VIGAKWIIDDGDQCEDIAAAIQAEEAVKLESNPWHLSDVGERRRIMQAAGKRRALDWVSAMQIRRRLAPKARASHEDIPRAWSNPDQTLDERQFRAALERAIEDMPAELRAAWHGRYDLDLTPREIDPDNPGSVSVNIHRAKQFLRAHLHNWRPGQER